MRRTGFQRKAPERPQARDRSAEFASVVVERPRARMAVLLQAEAPAPVQKDTPFRSEAWRRAVASLPCRNCGRAGETQCAHVNHISKGMGTKAHDCLSFPLCVACHREFDQGRSYTKEQRRQAAERWIIETIMELATRGLIRA